MLATQVIRRVALSGDPWRDASHQSSRDGSGDQPPTTVRTAPPVSFAAAETGLRSREMAATQSKPRAGDQPVRLSVTSVVIGPDSTIRTDR